MWAGSSASPHARSSFYAPHQYEDSRVKQDQAFESDFEREVTRIAAPTAPKPGKK